MTDQPSNPTNQDIYPRDQVEHFKIELARLRSENERLTGEVDYLRQALAAALSKIPQLEASVPATPPAETERSPSAATPAAPVPPTPGEGRLRESVASLRPYAGYFPLASFIAPPVVLLILLLLTLVCGFVLFGSYMFFAP